MSPLVAFRFRWLTPTVSLASLETKLLYLFRYYTDIYYGTSSSKIYIKILPALLSLSAGLPFYTF